MGELIHHRRLLRLYEVQYVSEVMNLSQNMILYVQARQEIYQLRESYIMLIF